MGERKRGGGERERVGGERERGVGERERGGRVGEREIERKTAPDMTSLLLQIFRLHKDGCYLKKAVLFCSPPGERKDTRHLAPEPSLHTVSSAPKLH